MVRHWQCARRLWPDTMRLQLPLDDCCRLVLPYNAVHSIQETKQIPNECSGLCQRIRTLLEVYGYVVFFFTHPIRGSGYV